MKKNAIVLIAFAAFMLLGASGGKKDRGTVTYTETVHGYNGDMVVEVDITGKKNN